MILFGTTVFGGDVQEHFQTDSRKGNKKRGGDVIYNTYPQDF